MERSFENVIVMGKSGAGKQPRIDVLVRVFGLKQLSTGNIFRTYLGRFNDLGYGQPLDAFYDSGTDAFLPDNRIKEMLGITSRSDAGDLVLGLKAKYYIDKGLFVPDPITDALFESAYKALGCKGVALDGFPRTVEQAHFLVDLANQVDARLDAILLVENDDDAIIKRTMGRRICKTCGEVFHIEFRPPPASGSHCGNGECDIVQRSDDSLEGLKARLNEFQAKTRPAIDYLVETGIPLYTVPGNLPNYSPEAVEASVLAAINPD